MKSSGQKRNKLELQLSLTTLLILLLDQHDTKIYFWPLKIQFLVSSESI